MSCSAFVSAAQKLILINYIHNLIALFIYSYHRNGVSLKICCILRTPLSVLKWFLAIKVNFLAVELSFHTILINAKFVRSFAFGGRTSFTSLLLSFIFFWWLNIAVVSRFRDLNIFLRGYLATACASIWPICNGESSCFDPLPHLLSLYHSVHWNRSSW